VAPIPQERHAILPPNALQRKHLRAASRALQVQDERQNVTRLHDVLGVRGRPLQRTHGPEKKARYFK